MSETKATCPLTRRETVDHYFMEHRAKMIDIAAFLDRVDRSRSDGEGDDFRMIAFRRALATLLEPDSGRTARVLGLFSDPTTEPIASAAGMKGALGACPERG